ncbi:cell division protein SepF [Lacticaseibacillus thailandensis]|uniref:Cell division protein SepF n=1 Tax=Lacticaseibacillus thailandensis DSM 22698 = JCM 13996 TaxID=1423810 RepID=A0A0R2C810_9LACO|nr:cell division protein SepF [Lacticaseibacillus thailandensis]KRM87933.1 hypothetical protein FD19_GL000212 [Lacticaseibacillus thailandensis DSM 22698 = JCM 13996]
MAMDKLGSMFGKFFEMDDDADEQDYADDEMMQSAVGNNARPDAPQARQATPAANHPNTARTNNVLPISGAQKGNSKIELYEPRVYSDAKEVGRNLLGDSAVLVNFSRMEPADAKRIVDFLTGLVFAINGEIKRVGNMIFLVTPANFEVSGNLAEKIHDDLDLE